jgi:hypothetical protein
MLMLLNAPVPQCAGQMLPDLREPVNVRHPVLDDDSCAPDGNLSLNIASDQHFQ